MTTHQSRKEDPHLIARLARELRELYVIYKRVGTPTYYKVSDKFDDAFFLRVAAWLATTQNPSAEAYVQMAFAHYGPDCKTNYLAAANLKQKFEARYANYREEVIEQFVGMQQLLIQYLRSGMTIDQVLSDDTLYFPPVFKYIAALRFGRPLLAERYAEAAAGTFVDQLVLRELYPKEYALCMNRPANAP